MFDFSFYTAHQRMLELEAQGLQAFLRDEDGEVLSLCNDGDVYCGITTFNWVRSLRPRDIACHGMGGYSESTRHSAVARDLGGWQLG